VLHLLELLAQGERDVEARRLHETDDVDAAVRERLATHLEAG
jgi:hypothetical protein